MKRNVLNTGLSLVLLSSAAYAGNNLISPDLDRTYVRASGYSYAAQFFDVSSGNKINRLAVEAESNIDFKIGFLTAPASGGGVQSSLLATDATMARGPVSDVSITPNNPYLTTNGKLKIKVGIDASAPTGASSRTIWLDSIGGEFASRKLSLNILKHTESGTVIGEGPDEKANSVTGIAVSPTLEETLDNVSVKVSVVGAKGVSSAHFELASGDASIASLAGSSCDITGLELTGSGSCIVQLTPHKLGTTKLSYTSGSYWISQNDPSHHSYEALPPIKVSVGTLYAGYQDNNVRRKNAAGTIESINVVGTNPGQGVSNFALDNKSHRLYGIDRNDLIRFDVSSGDKIQQESSVKLFNGTGEFAQVMTPTNSENELLVGSGRGTVMLVKGIKTSSPSVTIDKTLDDSIVSAVFDDQSNYSYFADGSDIVSYKDADGAWKSIQPTGEVLNSADILSVTANGGSIILVGLDYANAKSNLFRIENGVEHALTFTGNPFVGGKFLSLLYPLPNQPTAYYAVSTAGVIYSLTIGADGSVTSTALIDTTTSAAASVGRAPTDATYDVNGNVYFATFDGVYRISPAVNGKVSVHKLTNYDPAVTDGSQAPKTVVIDNNNN